MRNLTKPNERRGRNTRTTIALVKRLRRDENGGITIFTVLLLISMLIVGGMAVDFMRYESERAKLQSVSDRAVLAAADLDQTQDAATIVTDFFEKSGFGDAITGEVFAEISPGNRTVRVNSQIDVNTFYLRLIGIDTLDAPATAEAVEGTGNVEISLILDTSWSMRALVPGEYYTDDDGIYKQHTRMTLLQEAAVNFVDELLKEEYAGSISVNLVPYSQQVRVGDGLFAEMQKTPASFSISNGSGDTLQNGAQCVDFDAPTDSAVSGAMGDYSSIAFDDREYAVVEDVFMYTSHIHGLCPPDSNFSIIPLSQSKIELTDAIKGLYPTLNTSIHLGMKWGLALLDPSMSEILGKVVGLDEDFKGTRPSGHNDNSNTVKYVILMTDGETYSGPRLQPQYYDQYDERFEMIETHAPVWLSNNGIGYWDGIYTPHTDRRQNDWLQEMCGLARDTEKMTLYTIAMGAEGTANGEADMLACAGKASNAYTTNFSADGAGNKGIGEIFETIAAQILALRLQL